MSGPEQPKVIGEELSDERIRGFLDLSPYDSQDNADFFVLIRAYQALREGDFERLVAFFVDAGRDLNARNREGQTILDHIAEHRRSAAYVASLKQAGAKTSAQLADA
ncbi:PA4642 family protein [Marinobacter xestospongiae]|uniref:PA4642 family protein n=1 Tax=Marinobacter xestospongiae TaxID=994319 RepID=A0ABU3VZD3_9GAMM|nr:PA4642 family protein [Marinobacter xestospongiae]MDV2079614.1 PA4642 family protein [Marinobacter xestospongiae]